LSDTSHSSSLVLSNDTARYDDLAEWDVIVEARPNAEAMVGSAAVSREHFRLPVLPSPSWEMRFRGQVERFAELEDGWDGPGSIALADEAAELAKRVLAAICRLDLQPDRVVPTRDGDIVFYFFNESLAADGAPGRYASISCDLGDELFLTLRDRNADTTEMREATGDQLDEIVESARGFVAEEDLV